MYARLKGMACQQELERDMLEPLCNAAEKGYVTSANPVTLGTKQEALIIEEDSLLIKAFLPDCWE